MDKKIWIILTDDWELKGNGLGSVKKLQYEPALKLMELYEKLQVPAVFNIEVMQQLAFEQYANQYKTIKEERDYWIKAIEEMYSRRGFDIQLHIHPQWHNAIYNGKYWKLDKRWNIGNYDENQINQFIKDSINYLQQMLPNWRPKAFRSGSWGIVPNSDILFKALIDNGINLDVSVCQGIFYDGEAIKLDYTKVESPYLPYIPDWKNPLKIANKNNNNIIEIPTQSIKFQEFNTINLYFNKILSKIISINKTRKKQKTELIRYPKYIVLNPFGFKSGKAKEDFIIDFSNGHTLFGFKVAIDMLMKRAIVKLEDNKEFDFIPLIFENHTKNLDSEKFDKIEKIIKYIQNKYSSIVEFKTLSDVANAMDKMYVNTK